MVSLETRKTLGATPHLPILLIMVAVTLIVQPNRAKGSIYTIPLENLGNVCASTGRCAGITQYITHVRPLGEATCQASGSLEEKAMLADALFELESAIDVLNLDIPLTNQADICGELFDANVTYVELIPPDLFLEVDQVD